MDTTRSDDTHCQIDQAVLFVSNERGFFASERNRMGINRRIWDIVSAHVRRPVWVATAGHVHRQVVSEMLDEEMFWEK